MPGKLSTADRASIGGRAWTVARAGIVAPVWTVGGDRDVAEPTIGGRLKKAT